MFLVPALACADSSAPSNGSTGVDTAAGDTAPEEAPEESGADTAAGDTAPEDVHEETGADTGPAPDAHPTVRFEGGTFTMGSPEDEEYRQSDEQQHARTLTRPFLIGRDEVTQALAEELLGHNPAADGVDSYGERCDEGGVDPGLPVVCLTWYDAVNLANALSTRDGLDPAYVVDGDEVTWDRDSPGWRLPTEGEWEFVARAGTDDQYGVTADADEVCTYANVADVTATANTGTNYPFACDDGAWTLTPPGSYAPTPHGVVDQLGNVYEWVWDRGGDYPAAPEDDYAGPEAGDERVRRGGGWHSGLPYARPAYRGRTPPDGTLKTLGMRLARDAR